MVRFQVFDAVTGEETSEDALPRDIQGILNRYKPSSQSGGGNDLSRLARRQSQGMVGAGASGSYGRTRLPNNPQGKGGRYDISGIPKTQEELEEDADASYRYGAAPFDLFLGRGETFIDPTRGRAFLEGQSEEERAAGFQAFLENVGRRTPNYTLAEQRVDQQADREAAMQADSDRRQRELDGLKQYYDARTAQQLLDASNASRNVLAAPDEWEVGDESEWSVSQRAFDELWDPPATEGPGGSDGPDGRLKSVWTEMKELDQYFDNFGSTPDEIISNVIADVATYRGQAQEWAELASRPGATAQVIEAATRLNEIADNVKEINGTRLARYRELLETDSGKTLARLQEIIGEDGDIFDQDWGEGDLYREAMRAVRAADETASADVGDMTTPEGQAQAMAHLKDFSIVSEKDGETEISHELVQSAAEAEAALTYTFMTTPLSTLFKGEDLEFLRNWADTSNWSVVGEDKVSSPPDSLGAIMIVPNTEEQFYEILASELAFMTKGKATDPVPGWYSQAPTAVQVAVAKRVHQNLIATINPETGFPSPMLPTQTGGNG